MNKNNYKILDGIMQGIIIFDRNFKIVFWNQCLADWSGLRESEVLGKNLTELFPNLGADRYRYRFDQVLSGGAPTFFSPQIHNYLIPCRIGRAIDQFQTQRGTLVGIASEDPTERLAMMTLEDVTDMTYQIKELRSLSQLKDEFLSVCSHDLRSPLNAILGFTNILIEDEDEDAETRLEFLHIIKKSSEFLHTLISELLDLQKIQDQNRSINLREIDLITILRDSVQTAMGLAELKNISIVSEFSSESVPILGDSISLERSFNNMLSNAIKFTADGGKIKVKATVDTSTVKVDFVDSGIGIPQNVISKLFDRFSKASKSGTRGEKGTGLGLNITKELIAAHHGDITVQSTEGVGTTFTISLPILTGN